IKEKKSDQALLLVDFPKIDAALVLLKQKIAYASAKQKAVKPLKEVMDAAIDKVKDSDDFERFFQLVESIIAYHKAAGGE
ncbi:MAG: type III-A CRISPR-associated protein Csm2, partial [Cyanobacteriota bacterium]